MSFTRAAWPHTGDRLIRASQTGAYLLRPPEPRVAPLPFLRAALVKERGALDKGKAVAAGTDLVRHTDRGLPTDKC
ncbi:hypothetical protein MOX02_58060 [Methylobacterium oxalidis]|uniref:Uncharacterized protein n=1 Tax=Methylobacterium oxalidis TaxID=944322 RepID=A0A512JCT7_9HYPH|nr:hypothetical protein MOX02_58060 [Methylobacterium oxalidis]GLS66008.1 hypothetical protein GCM10007888_43900 [Methylobacterium oxalidis]